MNKIVKIFKNDIIVAPEKSANILKTACNRKHKMNIVGCCDMLDSLFFVLEEAESPRFCDYVFSSFLSNNEEEVISAINMRYYSGYTTIAGFIIKESYWGLFGKVSTANSNES